MHVAHSVNAHSLFKSWTLRVVLPFQGFPHGVNRTDLLIGKKEKRQRGGRLDLLEEDHLSASVAATQKCRARSPILSHKARAQSDRPEFVSQ